MHSYIKYKSNHVGGNVPSLPNNYKFQINEFYSQITKFNNEISCCRGEMNINGITNDKQKMFIQILKKNYDVMVNKNEPHKLSEIINLVPLGEIDKYITPNIVTTTIGYFNNYYDFLNNSFNDIVTEKIPFYKIKPVARSNNKQIDEQCKTEHVIIENCHLTRLGAQSLVRISMPISDLLKAVLSDSNKTEKTEMESILVEFVNIMNDRINKFNELIRKIDNYNMENFYTYDEKHVPIYGYITIIDINSCQECGKKECCGSPCIWTNPTFGRSKCVMK